eukprot:356111-Chlamydomonas_euryale.AAC.4
MASLFHAGLPDEYVQPDPLHDRLFCVLQPLWSGQQRPVPAGHVFHQPAPRVPVERGGAFGVGDGRRSLHLLHDQDIWRAHLRDHHDDASVPVHPALVRSVCAPAVARPVGGDCRRVWNALLPVLPQAPGQGGVQGGVSHAAQGGPGRGGRGGGKAVDAGGTAMKAARRRVTDIV